MILNSAVFTWAILTWEILTNIVDHYSDHGCRQSRYRTVFGLSLQPGRIVRVTGEYACGPDDGHVDHADRRFEHATDGGRAGILGTDADGMGPGGCSGSGRVRGGSAWRRRPGPPDVRSRT